MLGLTKIQWASAVATLGAALIAITLFPLQGLDINGARSFKPEPPFDGSKICSAEQIDRVKSNTQKVALIRDCYDREQNRQFALAGLQQQTRASDAAIRQTEIAQHALLLSWYQTIGGFITLAAAVAAAIYARRAALASESALEHERNISRPRLLFGGRLFQSWQPTGLQANSMQVIITIENKGSVPITKIRLYDISISSEDGIFDNLKLSPDWTGQQQQSTILPFDTLRLQFNSGDTSLYSEDRSKSHFNKVVFALRFNCQYEALRPELIEEKITLSGAATVYDTGTNNQGKSTDVNLV